MTETKNRKGQIFVLSGPSGAGKGTVRKRLFQEIPMLKYSISCTTRHPRPGEIDGTDYRFIDETQFRSFIREGAFLEWADVHGHLYGTLCADVERECSAGYDVVLEIDVQGAMQVRNRCKRCILIFLSPPSIEALEQRLRLRGTENEENVRVRLRNANYEMNHASGYDYLVVNDSVEEAAHRIREIILSERKRYASSECLQGR